MRNWPSSWETDACILQVFDAEQWVCDKICCLINIHLYSAQLMFCNRMFPLYFLLLFHCCTIHYTNSDIVVATARPGCNAAVSVYYWATVKCVRAVYLLLSVDVVAVVHSNSMWPIDKSLYSSTAQWWRWDTGVLTAIPYLYCLLCHCSTLCDYHTSDVLVIGSCDDNEMNNDFRLSRKFRQKVRIRFWS